MASIIGALIGALVGVFSSLITTNISYKSSTHSESGWREKLLTLTGKEHISIKELEQLRAFVHPFDGDLLSYEECSNVSDMIIIFYNLAKKKLQNSSQCLPEHNCQRIDSQTFRILCRALLKYDWINQTRPFIPKYFDKKIMVAQLKKY